MYTAVFVAFLLSLLATFLTKKFSLHLRVVDSPDGGRKKHARSVALWGGLPIFIVFWGILAHGFFYQRDTGLFLLLPTIFSLFVASLVFLCLGLADDYLQLSFAVRLPFLVVGVLVVALSAPIVKLTNPWGGFFALEPLLGAAVVFLWLMLTTVSVKILDGVDGLAAGIGLVGSLIIAALTLATKFYQPNVAYVALVLAAVLAGFLVFNLPPARIFLGESGSLFVGLMLGGLSVMAGSKIATALLVMAVPLLDMARVIIIRRRQGRPVFSGDRTHLHFVLIDRGWKEWQVLGLLIGVATLGGAAGLLLQSYQKIFTLFALGVSFVLFIMWISFSGSRSKL